jgi:hypothetical protein
MDSFQVVGSAIRKPSVWSLVANEAKFNGDSLAGCIDAARPHEGLHHSQLRGEPWSASLLGTFRADDTSDGSWPLSLAEAYVRGHDLVATYRPIGRWPFSPQLYWQANTLEPLGGVSASMSLLVSIQTQLLDTCPRISVASHLTAGELFLLSSIDSDRPLVEPVRQSQTISAAADVCCIILRLDGWPLSYIELMQPGEFREATLRLNDDGISVEWRLFADFLEKGVVRRARVHAALVARENDIELAAACCTAAQQLEIPLTT